MLLGGPLFGRFGDLFGAKAALVVAFISSLMFYFFMAIANSVEYLFLSRLCTFMMHAMHGELKLRQRAEGLGVKMCTELGMGLCPI